MPEWTKPRSVSPHGHTREGTKTKHYMVISPDMTQGVRGACRREPQPKGQNPLRMTTRTTSCAPARIPSPQPGIQPGSHPLPRLSPSKTHGKGYGTGRYPSCRYREPRPARSKQGICAHARPRHDPRLGQLRPRAPKRARTWITRDPECAHARQTAPERVRTWLT